MLINSFKAQKMSYTCNYIELLRVISSLRMNSFNRQLSFSEVKLYLKCMMISFLSLKLTIPLKAKNLIQWVYNKLNQNQMNFMRIFQMIKTGLPIFKSVLKAYKETTGGATKNDGSFFGQYFNKVMGQNNLSAPPLTESVALQILNIEKSPEELEARLVLERYYTLFKKNDPKVGGTTYLQSKVYAAKELLMARFPDAADQEQLFYKEVVQPEEKAEAEAKKAEEAEKGEKAQEEKSQGEEKKKE